MGHVGTDDEEEDEFSQEEEEPKEDYGGDESSPEEDEAAEPQSSLQQMGQVQNVQESLTCVLYPFRLCFDVGTCQFSASTDDCCWIRRKKRKSSTNCCTYSCPTQWDIGKCGGIYSSHVTAVQSHQGMVPSHINYLPGTPSPTFPGLQSTILQTSGDENFPIDFLHESDLRGGPYIMHEASVHFNQWLGFHGCLYNGIVVLIWNECSCGFECLGFKVKVLVLALACMYCTQHKNWPC